jgi:DNA-binding GntR family transcriptional regulator
MDIEEARQRRAEVRDYAARGLSEEAHVAEDAFHLDVLRAIANQDLTHTQAVVLATIALSTEELDFERWCA